MSSLFKRNIKIILTKETDEGTSSIVFSNDSFPEVTGTKYRSTLKDTATVTLHNLTYDVILKIINEKYYNIEIYAGYDLYNGNENYPFCIFKGAVLNIRNKVQSDRTNKTIISCGSTSMSFQQYKINLNYNSQINTYAAVSSMLSFAGVKNFYVSDDLRTKLQNELITSSNKSVNNFIEQLSTEGGLLCNADNSSNNIISLFTTSSAKTFVLGKDNIVLTNSIPTLSSDGLNISVLPTINFCPGNIIRIDNSVINIADYSSGLKIDRDGSYIIMQVEYDLSLTSNFITTLTCKSKSLYEGGLLNG